MAKPLRTNSDKYYIFKRLTRKNNGLWQLVTYFYFSSHIK